MEQIKVIADQTHNMCRIKTQNNIIELSSDLYRAGDLITIESEITEIPLLM